MKEKQYLSEELVNSVKLDFYSPDGKKACVSLLSTDDEPYIAYFSKDETGWYLQGQITFDKEIISHHQVHHFFNEKADTLCVVETKNPLSVEFYKFSEDGEMYKFSSLDFNKEHDIIHVGNSIAIDRHFSKLYITCFDTIDRSSCIIIMDIAEDLKSYSNVVYISSNARILLFRCPEITLSPCGLFLTMVSSIDGKGNVVQIFLTEDMNQEIKPFAVFELDKHIEVKHGVQANTYVTKIDDTDDSLVVHVYPRYLEKEHIQEVTLIFKFKNIIENGVKCNVSSENILLSSKCDDIYPITVSPGFDSKSRRIFVDKIYPRLITSDTDAKG